MPNHIIRKVLHENTFFLVVVALFMTLSSFIQASSIVTIAPIVDLFIHPNLNNMNGITLKVLNFLKYFKIPISLISVSIFFLIIVTIKNIMCAISQLIVSILHFRIIKKIIFDEFRAFLSANWYFFTLKNYGVLGNTLLQETEKVGLSFEAAASILSLSLGILFYTTVASFISWKLTLIILISMGIGLSPFFLLGKKTFKIGKLHTQASNEFQGTILETFNAIKLILGFGNQHTSITKLAHIIPTYANTAIQFIMIRALTPLAFEPIGIIIVLITMYLGLYHFKLGISDLFIILYAFRMNTQNALAIAQHKNAIQNMLPSLEQIYNLKKEAERMMQFSGHQIFEKLENHIQLKDVSFSYPNNRTILNNINITIPKGKMIAIVGKSGSGKTTLIDILMGFHEIKQGQFLVDNMPFNSINIESWRKRIGYVPQEPFLFNTTLRDNLLWSKENSTKEEIYEACKLSCADEFIKKFPNQYDTIVGDHGIRLSGGQRQRIALARAILRKPELLILDEATSSLDSYSEILIQKSIENFSKKTTLIIIAHRLSTIKKSDYIYVLNEGSILEEGTFDNLTTKIGGEFCNAAKLQGLLQTQIANEFIT